MSLLRHMEEISTAARKPQIKQQEKDILFFHLVALLDRAREVIVGQQNLIADLSDELTALEEGYGKSKH